MEPVNPFLLLWALGWYIYQSVRLALGRDTWLLSLARAFSCLMVAAVFYFEPSVRRLDRSFEAWAERNYTAIGSVFASGIIAFVIYAAWVLHTELSVRRDKTEELEVDLITHNDQVVLDTETPAEPIEQYPPYDWAKEVADWASEPDWQLR